MPIPGLPGNVITITICAKTCIIIIIYLYLLVHKARSASKLKFLMKIIKGTLRVEPRTCWIAARCSTTELYPLVYISITYSIIFNPLNVVTEK